VVGTDREGRAMTELTDEQLKARIQSMTWAERVALVIRCEEVWAGTPWEPLAHQLREELNEAKRELN
jgi:hypothetical protein